MGGAEGKGVGTGVGTVVGKGVLVQGTCEDIVTVPFPHFVQVDAPGAESVSVKLLGGHVTHVAFFKYKPGTQRHAPGREGDSMVVPIGQ